MSAAYTPGPWKFHQPDDCAPQIKDADGEFVTHVDTTRYVDGRDDPEAIANAHLIAAAPALLAALEKIPARYLDDMDAHTPGAAHLIRAAIAQARGEQ